MGLDKLDTIRKLLAKAERAATAAEAETYTAKAMELMARHGVDAALLAVARPGSDRIGPQRIAMEDPYSAGKARLLGWTATALGCVAALLAKGKWKWLPLALVPGYAAAWAGHFLVEKNRPATFKYPLWSFIADQKMFALTLAGRMGDEVERLGPKGSGPKS